MKQTLETFVLPNKDQLIKKLISSGYSFASWRMPNEDRAVFIISLDASSQLDGVPISSLKPGYLINSFDESHPIDPYFIPADIVIENDHLRIDPRVNDSQLDELEDKLKEAKDSSSTSSSRHTNNEIDSEEPTFLQNVEDAVKAIKNGQFEKVVVSRFLEERLDQSFSVWNIYQSLCKSYPNAFCSLSYIPGKGLWIGATPELLISENLKRFSTVALAGTKKLEKNQNLSEIAWTQKEIEEQAFVSRYIINCFKKIRLREFHEHGPKTVRAAHLAHLKTTFDVNYDEVSFDGLADQMLELLHPTSAVCGMPIQEVKPWIKQHENYDREFYAGFLGPVNFKNSTDLFVNLRCAKIDGNTIRYYAGAGITEDSDSKKEMEETEMKINVLRTIFNQD